MPPLVVGWMLKLVAGSKYYVEVEASGNSYLTMTILGLLQRQK